MQRVGLFSAIIALLSLGLATPAFAAAPGNDLYAGRTVISSIPFTDVVDTSEATTDADDAALNGQCGAPVTDASVWYEYTHASETDAELLVETFEGDYPVGIIVATGGPGSFIVQACGPGSVGIPAVAGETYAILFFDFQGDGGGNGGSLSVSLREMPPPPPAPAMDITVATIGSFDPKTGMATIRGTVSCTGGEVDGKNLIDLVVSQTVGRFRFNGQGFTTFACDGTAESWTAEVFSDNGKFGGGKATVHLFALACNEGGCAEAQLDRTVRLRS